MKTLKVLKNELTLLLSHFVKLRDSDENGICFCISCNKPYLAWTKEDGKIKYTRKFDGGHYFGKGAYPAIRYDEMNIHCQCIHCNINAIQTHFKENIIKRHGENAFNILEIRKNNSVRYRDYIIQALIDEYKPIVKKLEDK